MGRPIGSYTEGSMRHRIRVLLTHGRAMSAQEIVDALNLDQGKVRNAIAFDEHSDGGCSVHPERLVHDEREALDRVCAWIESESAAAK